MFAALKKNPAVPQESWPGLTGWAAMFRRIIPALTRRSSVGGALEHLGSLSLTAHSSLALVRLNDEMLLLGITPQGITLLTKSGAAGINGRRAVVKKNGVGNVRRVAAERTRG